MVGFHNFITFDSIHVPFYGNYCKYLLSNDFMGEEFSLILNSDEFRAHNHQSISLVIGSEVVTIQFEPAVRMFLLISLLIQHQYLHLLPHEKKTNTHWRNESLLDQMGWVLKTKFYNKVKIKAVSLLVI